MKPPRNRAEEAAEVALNAAYNECLAVNLDPAAHQADLSNYVAAEVGLVVREMAVDQRTADPAFAQHLKTAHVQNIYFADAGRRAAHSLLKALKVAHSLPTTRREESLNNAD